jgi:hypothetical protein
LEELSEGPIYWAVKLITGLLLASGAGTETIIIADDLITMPEELVALIV